MYFVIIFLIVLNLLPHAVPQKILDFKGDFVKRTHLVFALRMQEELRIWNYSHVASLGFIQVGKNHVIQEHLTRTTALITLYDLNDYNFVTNSAAIKCFRAGSKDFGKPTIIVAPFVHVGNNQNDFVKETLLACVFSTDFYSFTTNDQLNLLGGNIYNMPRTSVRTIQHDKDACLDASGQPTSMIGKIKGCVLVATTSYNFENKNHRTTIYMGPLSYRSIGFQIQENFYQKSSNIFTMLPYDIWQGNVDYDTMKTPCHGYTYTKNKSVYYATFCYYAANKTMAKSIHDYLKKDYVLCPFVGPGLISNVFHKRCSLFVTAVDDNVKISEIDHGKCFEDDDHEDTECAIFQSINHRKVTAATCCNNKHYCNFDYKTRLSDLLSQLKCKVNLLIFSASDTVMCATTFVLINGTAYGLNEGGFNEHAVDNETSIDKDLQKISTNIVWHSVTSVTLKNSNILAMDCTPFVPHIVYPVINMRCDTSHCDEKIFNANNTVAKIMTEYSKLRVCDVGVNAYSFSRGRLNLINSTFTKVESVYTCKITITINNETHGDEQRDVYFFTGEVVTSLENECNCPSMVIRYSAPYQCCWFNMQFKENTQNLIETLQQLLKDAELARTEMETGTHNDQCTWKGFGRRTHSCRPGHQGCFMIGNAISKSDDESKIYGTCIGSLTRHIHKNYTTEFQHALTCNVEENYDSCTWVTSGDTISILCCCNEVVKTRNSVYTCATTVDTVFDHSEAELKQVEDFKDTVN